MVSCKECEHYQPPESSEENPLLSEKISYCEKLRIKNVRKSRAKDCIFFTSKRKKTLEEKRKSIRQMTKEEIAKTYNMSKSYASVTLSALKRDRFEILKREDLSVEEMSKKLDISKSTIRSYLSALKQAQILERSEESK